MNSGSRTKRNPQQTPGSPDVSGSDTSTPSRPYEDGIDIDQCVKTLLSPDKMSAEIILSARPEGGFPPITMTEVREALKQGGIVHGIQEEEIEKALAELKARTSEKCRITAAKGEPPRDGRPAHLEFKSCLIEPVPEEAAFTRRTVYPLACLSIGNTTEKRLPPGAIGCPTRTGF